MTNTNKLIDSPNAKKLIEDILSGKIKLQSPFPGMNKPWTNEKKQELNSVLDKLKKN